jgi:hypothetical protein
VESLGPVTPLTAEAAHTTIRPCVEMTGNHGTREDPK